MSAPDDTGLHERFGTEMAAVEAARRRLAAAAPAEVRTLAEELDRALAAAIATAGAGERARVDTAARLPITREVRAALDATRYWGEQLVRLSAERERLRFALADLGTPPRRPARMSTREGVGLPGL